MSKIKIETEELEYLISDALYDLYDVRDKAQAAITKLHALKGTWLTKQELKQIK